MVNTPCSNVNREVVPIPDATLGGTLERPRGRPPKAEKAWTMPAPVTPKIMEKHEEEVYEAPAPPSMPNRLDETIFGIKKAMDTFAEFMAMQTQQNL